MQAFSFQVLSGVAKLPAEIKFRFSEKATKNLKKSPTWFDVTEKMSKQVGDFFQIL